MTKMTTEEAFVKVLQMHGIENAFGIIGSAFMPVSDLFPKAGITFWDVAHESTAVSLLTDILVQLGKLQCVLLKMGLELLASSLQLKQPIGITLLCF